MAEERLIDEDEDKDRKYRVKLDSDGEKELEINLDVEEDKPVAELEYEVPDAVDDESEAVMTPEQLAAKREREEREREERLKKVRSLLDAAEKDCKSGKFATALEYLEEAEETDDTVGGIYALRFKAYTRNYTDYSQIITAAEAANGIKQYATAEERENIYSQNKAAIEQNIADLRNKIKALDKENEQKKAERAVRFIKDRNKALIAFGVIMAALALFAGLGGYFATLIFSASSSLYLVLTCVFGGLALLALIALALAARRLNITSRRISMNKRNTTTKLGRELLAEQEKLKAYLAVQSALKD